MREPNYGEKLGEGGEKAVYRVEGRPGEAAVLFKSESLDGSEFWMKAAFYLTNIIHEFYPSNFNKVKAVSGSTSDGFAVVSEIPHDKDHARLNELLEKSRAGTISSTELTEKGRLERAREALPEIKELIFELNKFFGIGLDVTAQNYSLVPQPDGSISPVYMESVLPPWSLRGLPGEPPNVIVLAFDPRRLRAAIDSHKFTLRVGERVRSHYGRLMQTIESEREYLKQKLQLEALPAVYNDYYEYQQARDMNKGL